ncbi:MAG: molybdenum cofactor guanylyltransferase [Candidatus Acidiferrales bacterium]
MESPPQRRYITSGKIVRVAQHTAQKMNRISRRLGVGGYILAGGQSQRMGRDKALLELSGKTLLARAASLLEPLTGTPTVIGPPELYSSSSLRVIADLTPRIGPLGGILTALGDSQSPWNLILGCDLPFLTAEWLAYLIDRALDSDADAVIPQSLAGAEPLCAMYHKRSEPEISSAVSRGVRKVTDGLAALTIEPVPPSEWKQFDAGGRLFQNMNSPEDFEAARALFGGRSTEAD